MTKSDNCPITEEARFGLLKHVTRPDWERAAQIYQNKVSRQIYARYLERFLRCYSNPTGRRAGSHQPLDMYNAIVEAVSERQNAESLQNAKAIENLQRKIRIDKPAPVAL